MFFPFLILEKQVLVVPFNGDAMIATDRTARKFVGYLFGLVVRTTACHTKERECLTRFDALHRVPLWSRPSFEVPRSMCEFPLRRLERVGSDRL